MRRGPQILIALVLFGAVVAQVQIRSPRYAVEVAYDGAVLAWRRWRPATYHLSIQYKTGLFGLWPAWLADWGGFSDPAPRHATHPLPFEVSADKETAQAMKSDGRASDATGAAADGEKAKGELPRIEFSRVVRNGVSVFAGRAQANSPVTLFEGERAIAQAQAGSDGEWVIVTDHTFASLDASVAILPGAHLPPTATQTQNERGPFRFKAPATADASSAQGLISKFETVVAEARTEAAASAPETADEMSANGERERTSYRVLQQEDPPDQTVIPLPMQFVYNETTLTDDGRHAMSLLLEYLKIKKLPSITLTGHADERGGPEYNLDLSQRRLEVIERELRAGGYDGRIELMAKGESEPFMGIDRSRLETEELMQLDRRVELRITQ
jgi:outer membrane protein OmpA-like peptidoglycan-associated protein